VEGAKLFGSAPTDTGALRSHRRQRPEGAAISLMAVDSSHGERVFISDVTMQSRHRVRVTSRHRGVSGR